MADAPTPMADAEIDDATIDVDVDDETFPVIDRGEGPAVLLLHGFPDSKRMWRYQVPRLVEAGFRVLVPDMRGFGDAPKPQDPEPYALPGIMEDVVGIVDALGVDSVGLVGHDWGAAVAWITASFYADRVDRLVALCVGAPGNSATTSIRQREKSWYFYFFQFDTAEAWLRHDDWALFREWTRGDGDVERYLEDLSRDGRLTAGLNWYRANVRPEPPSDDPAPYPDVECPTLGVWPDGDNYLTEGHVTASTEKVAGEWRYERIEDASHWLMLDRPGAVNDLLVEFLDES